MAGHFFRRIFNRVRDLFCSQKQPANEPWSLAPLTPKYLEEEHGSYVATIEAALKDDQIRNIALSGNYGVGKSSILQQVASRQGRRAVELSLSTLAPIEESETDGSVPIEATAPTNLIQKEIVKQLLYRECPRRTPGSRFRRIERFRWWRAIGTAVLIGFVVTVIFLLTEWAVLIATLLTPYVNSDVWVHPVIWSVAALVALMVNWLIYGRLQIRQVSAGTATITLDDSAASYFDQYLDEIVYIFEVSGCNVVIFEDIDRFNDSHIFENLRALNTLLNISPQTNRPVRFIYAIKDSIFDRIGLKEEGRKLETNILKSDDPAQAEAIRANRTKFFDLVIPVVPFITHRSARDLATQQLEGIADKVAPELLDLVAKYVPDMRLLKNVRNEFIVFRDRIFSGDGEQLDLSETELFAMMLYKSTHLTDFEKIRLGKSNLDTLYNLSRDLVTENIKRLEAERLNLRQQIARRNGAKTRSVRLGGLLLDHIERTINSVSDHSRRQGNSFTWTIDGSSKSDDDLKSVEFWREFVSADGDPELRQGMVFQHSYNGFHYALKFSRSSLIGALSDSLDMESWNETDRKELLELINKKTKDIQFLRSINVSDLMNRPEFLVSYKDNKQSFETVARDILKSGLAYHLIRNGYINRNFTLYTSTFHAKRVTAAAMNFIIHHVEQNLMDAHFELAPMDVDAVVREKGKNALTEPALYNIAILDHLLITDTALADPLIKSLASLGERQEHFLLAYLSAGGERIKFVEFFTAIFSKMLVYLVSHADLDDKARQDLMDTSLQHLSTSKQEVDDAVSGYLYDHHADFKALTSDSIDRNRAIRIAELFSAAGIKIPRLELLSNQVCESFVERNLYDITYKNITIAISNTKTLALDVIRESDDAVYTYILENLQKYISEVSGVSATIDENKNFISIMEEVLEQDEPRLGDVIKLAAPDCQVEELAEVSEGAWLTLAEHQRFPATFNNVNRYVLSVGLIDAPLAKVLTATGEITKINTADEESKAALAIKILAASDHIPSAALRVKLISGLNLENYIDVEDVAKESGALFALLLKHNIISDSTVSYEHLSTSDWPTRKAFIQESEKFKDYMTPEVVQPDLAALLGADEINGAIKSVIVEQAATYAEAADVQGLSELANYAIAHDRELSPEVVQKMAQKGVSAQQVVPLLEPHLTEISRDQLFATLQALNGDYPELTEVGGTELRVPDTPADHTLLERLTREGIVSTYKYDRRKEMILIHRKRK